MKRILFVIVLVVMCASLFAQQITPYGSARVGYWYEMTDEDHVRGDRMAMGLGLQSNSRFGVNFRNNDLTADVEFGADGSVRFLWGKKSFGNWSLLAGLTEDGTNKGATQVYGDDGMLRNYGAVYAGRSPMIRFKMTNGFYAALMATDTRTQPIGATGSVDALIPRINLGYDWRVNDGLAIMPTASFQMYSYNEDFGHDGDVLSWLAAVTVDYKVDALTLKGHFNYGTNIGNMGYGTGIGDAAAQRQHWSAHWDVRNNETVDTATLGGFLAIGYGINPNFKLNAGVGFTQSSNDNWDEDDARMAVYLQPAWNLGGLRVIPEFGMLMEMDDVKGDAEGMLIYFGTQLRLDF